MGTNQSCKLHRTSNIKELPNLDPLQLVGFNFVKKYNGLEQTATVKDWTDEGKFIIEFISEGEELATYNDIIIKNNQKNEKVTELHVFTKILDHKKKEKNISCKLNGIVKRLLGSHWNLSKNVTPLL